MAIENEACSWLYAVDHRFIPRDMRKRGNFSGRWALFYRFGSPVGAEDALRRIRSVLNFGSYSEHLMLVDHTNTLEPTPEGMWDVCVMYSEGDAPVGTLHDAWCVMCDRRYQCKEDYAMEDIMRWLDKVIALLGDDSGADPDSAHSLKNAMRLANRDIGGMGGSVRTTFSLAPVSVMCASPKLLGKGVTS